MWIILDLPTFLQVKKIQMIKDQWKHLNFMDFFYTDWLVGGKLWLFFCSVNSHSKAGGTNKQKRVALSLASVSIYFLSCLLKGCKQKLRKCQGGFLLFFFLNLFFPFSRSRIWPESQLFAYSGILTDAVLYLGRIVKMWTRILGSTANQCLLTTALKM